MKWERREAFLYVATGIPFGHCMVCKNKSAPGWTFLLKVKNLRTYGSAETLEQAQQTAESWVQCLRVATVEPA